MPCLLQKSFLNSVLLRCSFTVVKFGIKLCCVLFELHDSVEENSATAS